MTRPSNKVITLIAATGIVVIAGYFISKRQPVIEVEKAKVETLDVKKSISASGTVKSKFEAELSAAALGRLERLNVEKGEEVYGGYILGNVSNVAAVQSSQAAKDARDVAKKDLEIYVENYASNQDAVGGKDEYNLNLTRLEELLSRAEANYQSTIEGIRNTYLIAPFNGTVVDINKEVGETVGAGTTIIKLADLDKLVFEIEIDQEDFGLLKTDQTIELTLDSYPNQTFSGKVGTLPLFADSTTEEFVIQLEINQKEEFPIYLGMKGDVEIVTQKKDNAQAVTFDVINEDDQGSFVWVVEDEQIKKEHIEVGLEGDLYTEVLTDLTNKNVVVPTTDEEIPTNAKVSYKE